MMPFDILSNFLNLQKLFQSLAIFGAKSYYNETKILLTSSKLNEPFLKFTPMMYFDILSNILNFQDCFSKIFVIFGAKSYYNDIKILLTSSKLNESSWNFHQCWILTFGAIFCIFKILAIFGAKNYYNETKILLASSKLNESSLHFH